MTTQLVIWTACPNGVTPEGQVRISVAVSPQLTPSNSPATLAEFPDWENWPATQITWTATVGTQVVPATVTSAAPSSSLYQALFLPTTPVDSYQYQSPSGQPLITYPASFLHTDVFAKLYTLLAQEAGQNEGAWPAWQRLVDGNHFGQLPITTEALNNQIATVMELYEQDAPNGGPLPYQDMTQDVPTAVTMAWLFLQSLTPPGKDAADTPPPPVPTFDFHKAYSLLQRHPALLRLFGFVVDLEFSPPMITGTVGLSVTPSWTPLLPGNATTNVMPVTMTSTTNWLAASTPVPAGQPSHTVDGLLNLSDGSYAVNQFDVDGAAIKSLNFVQAVHNANKVMPSTDTPATYGAPALRSAGLALSKPGNIQQNPPIAGHAATIYQAWQNNDAFNEALNATPPGPITLYAEDITQGYRIDVWDGVANRWFQLCARAAAPKPPGVGGYGIGNPQQVVPVPAGDEGWIEPAITQSAKPTTFPIPVYLPETMFRWDGWSQVASRPGKHISDDSKDSLQSDTGNPPPADAAFQLQIDYAATPGTLPALRFSHPYRFLARAVDLAGNSVPFDPDAPLTYASPEATYTRLEPVAPPVVVPCAPRSPGESLEQLVIRSNYNIPDTSPTIKPCERHLAPPGSSIQMLETIGVLGQVPAEAFYPLLADRDGLSYKTRSVLSRFGGKIDDQLMNGSNEWIYYPPVASPTNKHPLFGVPYLSEVYSVGVALLGLPGPVPLVRVPFGAPGRWPAYRAVRLVVRAGTGPPRVGAGGAADAPITVYAPKASVTTVRMSSFPPPAADGTRSVTSMTLWQWLDTGGYLTPELQALIERGLHYMFTPYRTLTIVHAVRQPLIPPQVNMLTAQRATGNTYVSLNGALTADPQSTQRVDMLAYYADPYDDGVSKDGAVLLINHARVVEFPLESSQPAGIPVTNERHDFGDTKHHDVFYSLLATTRFLEYFTETVSATLMGTTPVVVSKDGFAQGTVTVTGPGSLPSTTYVSGADYKEDDTRGSIARIPTGAIADNATVQVQFVAPPVTRSSLEPDAKPPKKLGFPLSIPSSARPQAPDVRYLLPAFSWQQSTSGGAISSTRSGNTLRVYLGRPWFSSGIGELLGVVVGAQGQQIPPALLPFMSGYGQDPEFTTGPVNTMSVTDFKLAVKVGTGLILAEQAGTTGLADVAGHQVSWDQERQLWFTDIEMNPGDSYFPFVKLALVRYQPQSIPGMGLELSRVVQADFIQLAPDRAVTLTFPSAQQVSIAVTGPGYTTSAGKFDDTMYAYVQQATVKTSDPDLEWQPGPTYGTGTLLTNPNPSAGTWTGTLNLPAPRGTQPFRVLIAEFEPHSVVRTGSLANLGSQITYLDAIQI